MALDLIGLLDREIEDARQAAQGEGWTLWAVLVAIASLVWVVVSALEKQPDLVVSTRILLGGIFARRTARHLYLAINGEPDAKGPVRYTSARIWGVARPELLLDILLDISVAILLLALAGNASRIALIGGVLITAVSVSAKAGLFVITFTSFAIPRAATDKVEQSASITALLVAVSNAVLSVMFFSEQTALTEFPADEVRLAGAAFGVYLLLPLWAKALRRQPLVEDLRVIRRELMIGAVAPEEALRETEIVLRGLRSGDVIQNEIHRLLPLIETSGEKMATAREVLHQFQRAIADAQQQRLSSEFPSRLKELRSLQKQAQREVSKIRKIYKSSEKRVRRLVARASAMVIFDPRAAEDLNTITELLSPPLSTLRTQVAAISEEMATADASFESIKNPLNTVGKPIT